MERVRKTHAVEQTVMEKIEQRPGKIGNHYGFQASFAERPKIKRSMDIQVVKKSKSRDKEKDGDTEPGKGFQEGYQMNVSGRIHNVLRANVNANNPHHGNAADIFDSGKSWLTRLICCLHKDKTPR